MLCENYVLTLFLKFKCNLLMTFKEVNQHKIDEETITL